MKNLVFLLFVIFSISGTAQNIFSPGYVVTAEGDTIRGLLLEKSDDEMSRRLIFRISEEAEIQKLTGTGISAFRFDSGREFERKTLLPKPGENRDTTYIFAKNVLRGQTDVFIGRHIQKRFPEIFLEDHINNTSIQVYRSRKDLDMKEFLNRFYNNPDALNNPQGVRFIEKRLLKTLAHQNAGQSAGYRISAYRESKENEWILMAGMPVDYSTKAIHFRGAVYFSRTRTERTSNFSSIFGIIYHHWERKEISITGTQQYGEMNTKWQMINLMPIGIRFQGNSGTFRPYGYIGAGIGLLRETDVSLEAIGNSGDRVSRRIVPTINSGIGIKTKIGKHFLITELTPTVHNLFLNLGMAI